MSARLDKIGSDLAKARSKRDEWDRRTKELERKYREVENTEIQEMVHAANLTPDKLAELLQLFATDMVPKTETIDSILLTLLWTICSRLPAMDGSWGWISG